MKFYNVIISTETWLDEDTSSAELDFSELSFSDKVIAQQQEEEGDGICWP